MILLIIRDRSETFDRYCTMLKETMINRQIIDYSRGR